MNHSRARPPTSPTTAPTPIWRANSPATCAKAPPLTPPAVTRLAISAMPTGSLAPDSPSRIVPLRPATSRCPSTEKTTAGSVGEIAVATSSEGNQARPSAMWMNTPIAPAVRKVPRTPTTTIGPAASRNLRSPMCMPPSNRMQIRATVTSRSTVRSGGSCRPGTTWTAAAAATSTRSGAGTLMRSVSRLERRASSPTTATRSTWLAKAAVSVMELRGRAWQGRCRPGFPALLRPPYRTPARRELTREAADPSSVDDGSAWSAVDERRDGVVSVLALAGVDALGDQVHDRGVGERGDVADLAVLGDVAQQPAHDLARAGLGQLGDDHDLPGLRDRADLLADVVAQLLDDVLAAVARLLAQDHERAHRLAGVLVRGAHDRGLRDLRVGHQRRLDLGGGEPVAGHVHHVVDAAEEPDVAVLVLLRAVAGEVEALLAEARPVGVLEPLVVAPQGAQHRRPGLGQDQVAARAVRDRFAVVVDDLGGDPGDRRHRRARLAGGHAGQRADHDRAGLGLPPGVHDRGTVAADHRAVPDVGLGVDRLADRAEQPQRRHVVAVGDLPALLHERADRGGRGVEDRDAVLLDDLPPAAALRAVRDALVHHLGGTVGHRSVDDVGVPGDPADVGGAPVHVGLGLEVEHRPVGVRRADQVAAGGVQDALGLAGRAGGVHDVERVLAVEGLGGVLGAGLLDGVVPPDVATVLPLDVLPGAAYDEHGGDVGALGQRFVDRRLEGGRCAASVAAVGGDHHAGVAVLDAVAQGRGGEAAEDHGVRSAEAG